MKRSIRWIMSAAVAALVVAQAACTVAYADDAAAAMPTGLRGEMIASLMDAGGKIQELASAMPEGKYAWRPSKEVRSVGEVYLHVIAENYMLPGAMGVTGGMSMDDAMKYDKTKADKATIQAKLKESYAFATKALAGMSDADLEAPIEVFGQKMSKRALWMGIVSHSHEHLGQSIAYARMNGVTPPWTAREMAEAKAEMEKKKATADAK